MPLYFPPPPGNPLSRLLTAVAAGAVLALAFFFGLVVLALVVGFLLLAWVVLVIRGWWLGRRSPFPQADNEVQHRGSSGDGQVLEGDYEVVSRRDEESRPD